MCSFFQKEISRTHQIFPDKTYIRTHKVLHQNGIKITKKIIKKITNSSIKTKIFSERQNVLEHIIKISRKIFSKLCKNTYDFREEKTPREQIQKQPIEVFCIICSADARKLKCDMLPGS